MGSHVFISHSSKDQQTAQTVCQLLESEGIPCWIAPRDVPPGTQYGEEIIKGIEGAMALVLIFSANANASNSVMREVERALNKDVPTIPFRIEDVRPSRKLEFFISTAQWMDAIAPPLTDRAAELVRMLRKATGTAAVPQVGTIDITVLTLRPNGDLLTPVAPFTFRLNRQVPLTTDSNGRARYINLQPGMYQVTEQIPEGWEQLAIAPANGYVNVVAGFSPTVVIFINRQTRAIEEAAAAG